MAESKEYIIKTTSSRELRLRKLADGNYQVALYWGKGDRTLATLIIEPAEWAKLASYSEGLKRK